MDAVFKGGRIRWEGSSLFSGERRFRGVVLEGFFVRKDS